MFHFSFFLASRSCDVAQWMPSCRMRWFWDICSLRNLWSFRSITPSDSSRMAMPMANMANKISFICKFLQKSCKGSKNFVNMQIFVFRVLSIWNIRWLCMSYLRDIFGISSGWMWWVKMNSLWLMFYVWLNIFNISNFHTTTLPH